MTAGDTCDKCGAVHNPAKCQGHVDDAKREAYAQGGAEARRQAKGKLRQCRMPPMKGLEVCARHGASGGRNGKAATRALGRQRADAAVAEEKIRKTLGRLNVTPVENPLVELQKLAGEAVAWKEKVAEHVAELERLRYATDGGEQIRGEIVLFERALDRCVNVLGAIARLNIDERLARVEERQVELVAKALSAAFAEMGMPQDQQREAIRRVGSHLRLAAG